MSNDNVSFSSEFMLFTYDRRIIITSLNPSTGVTSGGTDVLVTGEHFFNSTTARCKFGTVVVPAKSVTDQSMICTTPPNPSGTVSVEVTSNGADFSFSGAVYTNYPQAKVGSIWPVLGSAFEGGTIVTVHGEGFANSAQLKCKFGNMAGIEATWLKSTAVLCKTPQHQPGLVTVQVANNGVDFSSTAAEYLYVKETSVQEVRPSEVLGTGQVPVLVRGSNFLNTSTLACRFGVVSVRASFLTPWLVACTAPSHSAQPRLQRRLGLFPVEVSVNGLDYTDSGKMIEYVQPSPLGYYEQDWVPALSPNGTYCPGGGSVIFSLCEPGSFQPSSGAAGCLLCPVGFICPGVAWLFCPAIHRDVPKHLMRRRTSQNLICLLSVSEIHGGRRRVFTAALCHYRLQQSDVVAIAHAEFEPSREPPYFLVA